MSLTKATYSMILGAPVNVKDFGAKGDGTTDDTAAIQAAIDSATSTGLVIYFPAGTYKTTAKLYTNYGKNIKLYGGDVYNSVFIVAYHADHIFQYNYTVHIDGINFSRNAAYVTAAVAATKSSIYSDDTGGAIDGAAYSIIENCVCNGGSYVGITMWGTHQMAINNVVNSCTYGFQLKGANHTLMHNSTEQNSNAAIYIFGNGMHIVDNYADDNCSGAAANHGVITVTGSYNRIDMGHFNGNNNAQHYWVSNKYNYIGSADMYNTSAFPKVTVTSFNNTFDSPVFATVSGADGYQNYFHPKTDYTSGTAFNDFGPVYMLQGYAASIASGASAVLASGQPIVVSNIQHILPVTNFSMLANGLIEIMGVSIAARNPTDSSNAIAGSIKVRNVAGNADYVTLLSISGNEQFGYTNTAEGATKTTTLASIPVSGSSYYPIYLTNSGGTTMNNVYYTIVYRLKSNGTYA